MTIIQETDSTDEGSDPIQSSAAERLTKKNNQESQSAMDIFLAAMEESKHEKSSSPSQRESKIPTPVEPVLETQPLMGNQLILQLESMIQSHLPQLKEFHVANAMDTFDRPILKAIWTTHRTKFLMNGQLEYAVSSLSVIDALVSVPSGYLVAAYVETTASDYLIWVDFTQNRLVAAFADAGTYFG